MIGAASDFLLRSLTSALSPAGPGSRLSTLIFHRVLAEPDPLQPGDVTLADFEAILDWITQQFNVISMKEAIDGLKRSSLPARPAVISFDDGYADNHDCAAPALRWRQLPATFFVASGYLDGGCMFNDTIAAAIRGCKEAALDLTSLGYGSLRLTTNEDRQRALSDLLPRVKAMPVDARTELAKKVCECAGVVPPSGLMMTSEQVAALHSDGFEIGAHTFLHPILATLDRRAAEDEIERGRQRLVAITKAPVSFFAYPNGRSGQDFTRETVEVVKSMGFDAAFTTDVGVASRTTDLHQLPRFTPWDREKFRFGRRMVANLLKGPIVETVGGRVR